MGLNQQATEALQGRRIGHAHRNIPIELRVYRWQQSLHQREGGQRGLVRHLRGLRIGRGDVIALAMLSRVPTRVEQVAFLLVAGVLMLKLAYDPQLALWLLSLAVVARPRWRDLLVWQAGEVLFFAMHYWWLGGLLAPGGDGQAGFYFIAIAVRLLCTGWLVAMVVRDVWVPELDPVAEERDFDRRGTTVLVG